VYNDQTLSRVHGDQRQMRDLSAGICDASLAEIFAGVTDYGAKDRRSAERFGATRTREFVVITGNSSWRASDGSTVILRA